MRRRRSLRMTSQINNKWNDSEGEESEEHEYQPKKKPWSHQLRSRFVLNSGNRSLRVQGKDGHPRRSIRFLDHFSSPSEDDDERIFTPPLASRLSSRISARRLSHKNYRETESNERETPGFEIRRSKRQRKLKYANFNDSWIVGSLAQSLKGYPSLSTQFSKGKVKKETIAEGDEVEEEEEEEEEEEDDDDEDDEGEEGEEIKVKEERRKRSAPSGSAGGGATTSEDRQEKPNGEVSRSERRTRQNKSADTSNERVEKTESEETGGVNENGYEDMYARVKQRRRPRAKSAGSSSVSSSSSEVEIRSRPRRLVSRSAREAARVQKKYSLRQKKPTIERFQAEPISSRSRVLREVFSLRKRRRRDSSTSSSSSSRGSRYDRKKAKNKSRNRLELCQGDTKRTGLLADVDPLALDKSITFSNIGGLEHHVTSLKEMVVFPILYPEVFAKFNVTPPKGVLFHGPPGTGKTLMARALANECSVGAHKVSFFMRKGADVLSKWVGESERQLRILFEEAHSARPSIIFFDELDGLCPVRSTKQDQIHASIVCTLLALMDGLDNRGDIIIIGATNRIDSIDPALRRPGRFDRELNFPLPGVKERREILQVHAGKWANKETLNEMAETSVSYCGSDLKALCTEAVIHAVRRVYPQIYTTSQKLLINHERVNVERVDFEKAQRSIVPASQRAIPSIGRKLPQHLEPLLSQDLASILSHVGEVFPAAFNRANQTLSGSQGGRVVIVGKDRETSLLAAGLLYKLEHCPMLSISLDSLYADSSRNPEEAITKVFKELPHNRGSVLWFGEISAWWASLSRSSRSVFKSLLMTLDTNLSILFLATSTSQPLPSDVRCLFSEYRGEVFRACKPTIEQKEAFFRPLFRMRALKPPTPPKKHKEIEELKIAPPPPPPKLSDDQLKIMFEDEENTLRELRIFLRQICAKLARNKQFYMFSKPVDINEVADYLQIIKEPMDLETMMTKIDLYKYTCAQDFLSDVDLLCKNALEYNPDRDAADKLIRHRACYLRDTAYALIKAEMDSDFEVSCKNIREARQTREENSSQRFIKEFFKDEDVEGQGADGQTPNTSSKVKEKEDKEKEKKEETSVPKKKVRKRMMTWSKGVSTSSSKRPKKSKPSPDSSKDVINEGLNGGNKTSRTPETTEQSFTIKSEDTPIKSPTELPETCSETDGHATEKDDGRKVNVDRSKLCWLLDETIRVTEPIEEMEPLMDLFIRLKSVIDTYRNQWERNSMVSDIELELSRFGKEYAEVESS